MTDSGSVMPDSPPPNTFRLLNDYSFVNQGAGMVCLHVCIQKNVSGGTILDNMFVAFPKEKRNMLQLNLGPSSLICQVKHFLTQR